MLTSSRIIMYVDYGSVQECLEVLTSFLLTEPMVYVERLFCSLSVIRVRCFAWVTTRSSPFQGKQFVMSANIVEKFTPFRVIEIM